jgi:methylenetetrahydrofolate reductase (NADH)
MTATTDQKRSAIVRLLYEYSVEMTGRDIVGLGAAAAALPAETRVNVTHIGNEEMVARVAAAGEAARLGLIPVPHIAARRITSQQVLEQFLAALQSAGASASVFAVGGDPHTPAGPFEDTLALLRSGSLERFGATDVSISGYPEGHPGIDDAVLWRALTDKQVALWSRGLSGSVITQFAFDADAILAWVVEVRERGIEMPIRIGVPGPTGVKRLLGYAKRFGVGSSAGIARKYGLSLANLMSTAGPDRFLDALAQGYDPVNHGVVQLHFYTFGGLEATARWISDFAERESGCSGHKHIPLNGGL